MDGLDLFRIFNASLATFGFLAFAIRVNDDWTGMTRGWRVVRVSMLGSIFVLGFSSVEVMMLATDVPLGIRTFLATSVLMGLLLGLWMVRREPTPQRAVDEHCSFPGCILARKDLRAAARKYPQGIPPHIVLGIIDGVEAHEHR